MTDPISNHSPLHNESLSSSTSTAMRGRTSLRTLVHTLVRAIKRPVRVLSFWTAIVLPFAYLPLLTQGLENAAAAIAFVTLLAANVVALYAGHGYKRP